MIIKHAGQWYEGTSAERIGIGLPTRNGVWFHDTDEGALYYLYNGTWINLSVAADVPASPLLYARGEVATLSAGAETTLMTYTIPADTLVYDSVLVVESSFYVGNPDSDTFRIRLRYVSTSTSVVLYDSGVLTQDGSTTPFRVEIRLFGVIIDNAGAGFINGHVKVSSGNTAIYDNDVVFVANDIDLDEDGELRFTGQVTGSGTNDIYQIAMAVYNYQT